MTKLNLKLGVLIRSKFKPYTIKNNLSYKVTSNIKREKRFLKVIPSKTKDRKRKNTQVFSDMAVYGIIQWCEGKRKRNRGLTYVNTATCVSRHGFIWICCEAVSPRSLIELENLLKERI